jgi:hypothetical protein
MMAKKSKQTEPTRGTWDICESFLDPIVLLIEELYEYCTYEFDDGLPYEVTDVVTADDYLDVKRRLFEILDRVGFSTVWIEVNISVELADRLAHVIKEIRRLISEQVSDVEASIKRDEYYAIGTHKRYLRDLSAVLKNRGKQIQWNDMPDDNWLGPYAPSEIQKQLGISPSTWSRRLQNGEIKVRHKAGRRYYLHRSELRRDPT